MTSGKFLGKENVLAAVFTLTWVSLGRAGSVTASQVPSRE